MLIYILMGILAALMFVSFCIKRRYVVAQPNEWMIVLKGGKLIKCGVGISVFQGWDEKIVKFPSKIHKVPFTAQQVTTEMQGIEVSGIIIWTIFRDGDGPLRAYKMLGSEINQEEPQTANQNLVEMANGIVRHKIANSTISEILRNRQIIREDVKKELNKSINGWGVWLETVEITDVRILSNSLFQNLQTEFREAQRQKAEIISMKADNEMKEKKLTQNLEFAKKEAENETKKQIIKSNEQLKINLEKQKNYEFEQEIQRQKLLSDQELKKAKAEAQAKLQTIVDQNAHELQLREIEITLKRKEKDEEIAAFEAKLAQDEVKDRIESENFVNETNLENERKLDEMRRQVQEAVPFEIYALEKVKDLMCSLPLNDVKIYNFTNDGKNNSIGSAIQQLLSEFQVIKKELPAQ